MIIRKVSETASTITLGWTPVAGYGYLFFTSQDGTNWTLVSRTNDPSRDNVKFSKGAAFFRVSAIAEGEFGVYPAVTPEPEPTPNPAFGTAYNRMPRSPGSTIDVSTWAAVKTQWATAPAGSIIRLTQPVTIGMSEKLERSATAGAPLTLTGAPISGGQLLIEGAYARIWKIKRGNCYDGFKSNTAQHIEYDEVEIHDTENQGIQAQTPGCLDVQVWNSRLLRCGLTGTQPANQRHAIYFGTVDGGVVANSYFEGQQAYAVQLGPSARNVVVACNRMKGGVTRGGIVVWTEGGVSRDVLLLGNIIEDGPSGSTPIDVWGGIPGVRAYDNIGHRVGTPSWGGADVQHWVVGDPAQIAKGFIRAGNDQWIPAKDALGNARVTRDAGHLAI